MSINLMPWREARRKERQKDFVTKIGMSALVGVAVVLLTSLALSNVISGQEKRNTFLEEQIKTAETDIKEIQNLEQQRSQLLGRKQVIEQLQADRDLLPYIFYELAANVVDGVITTNFEHKNNLLQIQGKATSNAAVAAYMRNIERSAWFDRPEIIIIQNQIDARSTTPSALTQNDLINRYGYNFTIRTGIRNPYTIVEEEEATPAARQRNRS